MRIATSAGTVAGVLALVIVVRPTGTQQQAAVRVPTSVLERYVGEYVHPKGGGTVTIRLRGDSLVREEAGHRLALPPISETQFRVAGTALVTELVIDEAGVTQSAGSGRQHLLRLMASDR